MDAQHRRKGARQYCLQWQWQPTDKQTHRNAAGDCVPITGKPWSWNSGKYVAGAFHHTTSNGRRGTRIKASILDFEPVCLIQRGL